jgi:ketopantoate hydroxymethyltransferase
MIDEVEAVIRAGLHAYPQIGFEYVGGAPMHGSPADMKNTLKWAHEVERRGASMIDLTMVSHDIYREVCKAVKIPVIGGQTGSEADGKIFVGYALTGYNVAMIGKPAGPENAAAHMYAVIEKAVKAVHADNW